MKTVKQDLLMFVGTRAEVDKVESINKCLYFAWDTGEFFLGTHHDSKTRYGGSRSSISKTEVLALIQDELEKNDNNLRLLVSENRETVINNGKTLEAGLNELRNEMAAFKQSSVEYIQSLAQAVIENISEEIITAIKLSETLSDYYSKEEGTETFVSKTEANAGYMQYLKGSEIVGNLLKLNGIYFCTDTYTSSTLNIQAGSIYRIANGKLTELAISGGSSGGGGSAVTDNIELFTINGKEEIVSFEEDFNRVLNIKIITTSPADIKQCKLYFDNVIIGEDILITNNTIEEVRWIPQTVDFNLGEHALKLVCQLKSGARITKSVPVNIVRPIYYGAGTLVKPAFNSLQKVPARVEPTGEYTVEPTSLNGYIWFVYPIGGNDAMFVDRNKFTANGFKIPTIVESTDEYMYIRTSNAIIPSTVTFSVVGGKGVK